MHKISLTVNGRAVTAEVPANRLLVDLLREDLQLTGTHVGCDTSQCGACVVLLNGQSVKSCSVLAVQLDGASLVTIEGLANGETLHPMQAAFREHHALQCGFCTPGMVLTGVALAEHNPNPLPTDVRAWLEGNLCRCTGYNNIIKAIQAGARAMHPAP
jgi:aerobic carbon-monoxide dehydrogenase small subunit